MHYSVKFSRAGRADISFKFSHPGADPVEAWYGLAFEVAKKARELQGDGAAGTVALTVTEVGDPDMDLPCFTQTVNELVSSFNYLGRGDEESEVVVTQLYFRK